MSPEEPKVITVSREALRAELAEFELRMRDYLDVKLRMYALTKDLDALRVEGSITAQSLERGEIPTALKDAILLVIRDEMQSQVNSNTSTIRELRYEIDAIKGWRNRMYGALMLVTFVMPVLATVSWHLWG